MSAKNHHTIPRMHLKHFAGREPAGQVWSYDALEGRQWSAIPDETCTQTHFYSAETNSGVMDTQIEDLLAGFESRAAPVYEDLLKERSRLDAQARHDFAEFLALMFTRTTAMRRMTAELQAHLAQIHCAAYAGHPKAFQGVIRRVSAQTGKQIDAERAEQLRQLMLNPKGRVMHVARKARSRSWARRTRSRPLLYAMKWSLIAPRHGYFITSDNPWCGAWIDGPTTRSMGITDFTTRRPK